MPLLFLIYWFWQRRQKDKKARFEALEDWKTYDPEKVFGQAFWGDRHIIDASGAFNDQNGIPLAYFDGKPLYHNENTSIITFGRSGDGKTETLIGALLQCPNMSFVVPDIDGELFNCTAEQRSKYGDVVVLDGYHMFPDVLRKIPRGAYNPINRTWLDPAHRQFAPRCSRLTSGIIPQGHGRDEYWYQGSREMTTLLIMILRKYAKEEKANLTHVAKLAHGDVFGFFQWAVRLLDNDPLLLARVSRWANPRAQDIRSLPEVAENTKSQLVPWLDESVESVTCHSTFNFSECAERVMTVYKLVPHELLHAGGVSKYVTTMNTCATSELIRFNPNRRVRTVIELDEFYELPLEEVDHLLISARKAKVTLWICMQDVNELVDLYPKTYQTFLSSSGAIQILGASDLTGSELFSKMLAQTEVTTHTKTRNWSAGMRISDPPTWAELSKLNVTWASSKTERPLMLAQDIRSLSKDQQILMLRCVGAPILAEKKSYRHIPSLAKLAGVNPYYVLPEAAKAIGNINQNNWKTLLS